MDPLNIPYVSRLSKVIAMSKLFWALIPLNVLLFYRELSHFSAANVISLAILSAAVFYQVRAYRALREYEKAQHV